MGNISIRTEGHQDAVLLSNRFIDEYMPGANGEFVKVYLYLLRMFSCTPASFGLSRAADLLNCTERDILRAMKYWAKENLLDLTLDDEDNVISVTLLPIPSKENGKDAVYAGRPEASEPKREQGSAPVTAGRTGTDPAPKKAEAQITREKRDELSGLEEIQQLLFLAQQYLGKTLTPVNVDKILYFYDVLKFSTDLIEYLIEYCVSRGHQSMRYIETVAYAWAEQGITTVEAAKKESSRYQTDYYSILKAMGISGRNPIDTEIRYMDLWRNKYGLTLDIITEACSRTVLQTGQQSFPYADRILEDWYKKGVRSLQDVEKLDLAHQRKKSQNAGTQGKNAAANRFNNFNQRNYDFQEYEKRLLEQN